MCTVNISKPSRETKICPQFAVWNFSARHVNANLTLRSIYIPASTGLGSRMIASDKYSPDIAHFVYCCHWNLPWVKISTMACVANTLFTRKFFSVVLSLYNSDKSNAQKSYIQKIDVYSYRRAHKRTSFSAWLIL